MNEASALKQEADGSIEKASSQTIPNSEIAAISNSANSQQLHTLQSVTVPQHAPTRNSFDDFINTELTLDEKRKLRFDLLSLPPEKLGEIMYVLQKSQPQNVVQKDDELEIDLKRLNTKTLRHLQRYIESVFAKVRQDAVTHNLNGMQVLQPTTMFVPAPQNVMLAPPGHSAAHINPWQNTPTGPRLSAGDLITPHQTSRKRSFNQMIGVSTNIEETKTERKRRSAFSSQQKDDMIRFWNSVSWRPNTADVTLEQVAKDIGVTAAQLKVFRQNNKKKYTAHSSETPEQTEQPYQPVEPEQPVQPEQVDQAQNA